MCDTLALNSSQASAVNPSTGNLSNLPTLHSRPLKAIRLGDGSDTPYKCTWLIRKGILAWVVDFCHPAFAVANAPHVV
jgi:hypothetical protein